MKLKSNSQARNTQNNIQSDVIIHGYIPYRDKALWSSFCLSPESGTCLVVCNPFLEERINSHPYLVYWCNYLMRHRISSCRFDYSGVGESIPPRSTYSLEEYAEQTVYLIRFLQKCFDRVGVFVLASSSLLMEYISKLSSTDFCLVWEPIISTEQYVKSLIRANILEQQTIFKKILYKSDALRTILNEGGEFDIEGHHITSSFVDSMNNDFIEFVRSYKKPLMISCMSAITFDQLNNSVSIDSSPNVRIAFNPIDAMFWKSSCSKYSNLPFNGMEENVKWIQSII
jgi:hypothetical protein